jgi:uncharacterized C2H2 Zn-finger protein
MLANSEELKKENEDLKKVVKDMKKDDSLRKKEFNKVKDENAKLCLEIGKVQCDKDKVEAKTKAAEKVTKMKKNTQLFNKIIEQQIADGEIVNVDMSKYKDDGGMEECDGGAKSRKTTGYGSMELQSLVKNKIRGGRRTSPQDKPEMKKTSEKKEEAKMFKCPQCDFISQNKVFFNEHVTKAHAGKPTCPFCYNGFEDLPSLRKYCELYHKEAGNI